MTKFFPLWVMAAVVISACGDGDDTGTEEMCGENGSCPPGFMCNPVTNRCIRTGLADAAVAPPDSMTATAPNTTITMAPPARGNVAAISISFTSDRSPATFECRLGTEAFASCASPFTRTVAEGTHTFEVRAIAGGLTDGSPASATFTVDTTAPDTTITAGPQGNVTATEATFTFTSSEPTGATFRCRLGDAAFAACDTPRSFTGLTPGTYTFAVAAVDAAGNVDGSPATRTFTVLAALDTMIVSGPPPATQSRTATFTYTATVAAAGFECSLDGGPFEDCDGGTVTYQDLADGEHDFAVRAVVGAQVDDTPAERTWTVDLTGLGAVITSGAEGGVVGASVTFTYVASAAGVTYECGLGGVFEPCAASGRTFDGLVHGTTHTFAVRARLGDLVGDPDSRMFTVDTMPPTVDITAPRAMQVLTGPVTVTFTVNEPGERSCSLNGTPLTTCVSGMVLDLAEDDYTLVVSAEDAAGNSGGDMVLFSVDLAGPTVQILRPSPGGTTGPDGDVALDPGEGAVRVECTLDDEPVDCTLDGFAFLDLDEGLHHATAQAFDAAQGGTGGEIAMVEWQVDATPPLVTSLIVTDVAPGVARLAYTLSDDSEITAVRCRIDGGPFAQCGAGSSGTFDMDELAPGEHLVEVYGVDEHQNSGNLPSSAAPPATFARVTFTHVSGPGHLVIIGNDYADPLRGAKPGATAPVDWFPEVLANAVSMTPATGFDRGIEIAIVDEGADADERENVVAILDSLATPYELRIVPPGELAGTDALVGADLLLVLDQNGRVASLQAIGAELEPELAAYLDAGGIAIVIDGGVDTQNPSETYRVIAPELLLITAVTTSFGAVGIPCNDEDPVVATLPASGIDRLSGSVVFTSPEPWVALAQNVTAEADGIAVLHKWFGEDPDVGPVAISVNVADNIGDRDVFFQDADFSQRAYCRTLSNGTAVHHMNPGGHVSVGAGANLFSTLTTVMAVAPVEHFDFRTLGLALEPSPPTVTVHVVPLTGAEYYNVDLGGCSSGPTKSTDIAVQVCGRNDDNTYNVAAEAYDPNDVLIGYSLLTGQTAGQGGNIDMGGWTEPPDSSYFTPSIALGTLDQVANVSVEMGLARGWLEYEQQLGPVVRGPTDLAFPSFFYSASGGGSTPFDRFEHTMTVLFERALRSELTPISFRRVHGGLISSLAVTLSSVLLPRLGQPVVTFDVNDRMVVTWGASGSLTGADGAVTIINWQDSKEQQGLWLLYFPAGTSVTAPPPPPGNTVALSYWAPADLVDPIQEPESLGLIILDASFFSGYTDFRRGLGLLAGSAETFLLPDFAPFELRVTQRINPNTIGNQTRQLLPTSERR
jgi:hypothetical protein